MVDFDLLKAKAQMGKKPAPPEVSQRQEIIDRRLRKKTTAMTPSPINNAPKRPMPPPKPSAPIQEPELPTVEEIEQVMSEEGSVPEAEPMPTKTRRRQKTKPKTTSGDENADTTD